jgi:hypothetical protein
MSDTESEETCRKPTLAFVIKPPSPKMMFYESLQAVQAKPVLFRQLVIRGLLLAEELCHEYRVLQVFQSIPQREYF